MSLTTVRLDENSAMGHVSRAHPELAEPLNRELAAAEALLHSCVESPESPFITAAARHLIRAGGQRLRPLMALLGARFGTSAGTEPISAAVLVELIHVASLHHDDVMDQAGTRRGAPTVNALWGNKIAVLLGDHLLVRAAEIAVELGTEPVRLKASTFERLVRGQLRECVAAPDGTDLIGYSLSVVSDKSAALISMAAQLGATVAGAPEPVIKALTSFSELLGVAFQLSDDVLDITGAPGGFGKATGTDLREGVITIPVLHALNATSEASAELRALLAEGPLIDSDGHDRALELVRRSPGLLMTQDQVGEFIADARSILDQLPDIPARRGLDSLCDFVLDRTAEGLDQVAVA